MARRDKAYRRERREELCLRLEILSNMFDETCAELEALEATMHERGEIPLEGPDGPLH